MDDPQKQTTKKNRIKYDSTKSLIEALENFKLKASSEKTGDEKTASVSQQENTCKVFDDIMKEANTPRISKRVLEYEKECAGPYSVLINYIEELN